MATSLGLASNGHWKMDEEIQVTARLLVPFCEGRANWGRTSEVLFKEIDVKWVSWWVEEGMQRHTHQGRIRCHWILFSTLALPSRPSASPPGEACHFPLHFQLLSIMPEGQCLAKACLSGRTIATEAATGLGFGSAPGSLPLGPQDGEGDIGGENDTTVLQVPEQDPTEASRHITGVVVKVGRVPQTDPHTGFCPSASTEPPVSLRSQGDLRNSPP